MRSEIYMWKACVQCFNAQCVLKITREKHVYSVSTHSASWKLHMKSMCTVFQRTVRPENYTWKACVQCFNAQCVLKITHEKHVYSVSTHSASWKLHVKSVCTAFQRYSPTKEPRCPLYRRLGGAQGWSGRMRKIPPAGIRSPENPARSSKSHGVHYN